VNVSQKCHGKLAHDKIKINTSLVKSKKNQNFFEKMVRRDQARVTGSDEFDVLAVIDVHDVLGGFWWV